MGEVDDEVGEEVTGRSVEVWIVTDPEIDSSEVVLGTDTVPIPGMNPGVSVSIRKACPEREVCATHWLSPM